MKNYSEKELQEKYEKLPQKMKEALSSSEVSEEILEIGERLQISETEMGELAKICGEVLTGILPLKELPKEIKEKLGLDDETISSLIKSLESKIFSRYKEELENIYGSEKPKLEKFEEMRLEEPTLKEIKELEEKSKLEGQPSPGKEELQKDAEKEPVFAKDASSSEAAAEAESADKEEKPVEKIEIKEELLKKKGPDKYREPIEKTEETEQARIVKEGGKIKKIF